MPASSSIDAEPARRLPGVAAVVTCLEAMELCEPMPDFGPAPDRHAWRCMAADKVRFVGEPVAAIVATSRYVAEDARDLIEVEYELLDPVVDATTGDGPVRVARARGHGLERRDRLDAGLRRRRGGVRIRGARRPRPPVLGAHRRPAARDRRLGRELRPRHRDDDHPLELRRAHELPLPAREGDEDPANKLDLHPHPAGGASDRSSGPSGSTC